MHQLRYWLAAHALPTLDTRHFLSLLKHFPDIKSLYEANESVLLSLGLAKPACLAMRSTDWKSIDEDLQWASQPGCHIIHYEDAGYPILLKEITDPPLILYVRGNVDLLARPQLAIVGARKASEQGIKLAYQFAAALTTAGLVVTSGLALGIDAAAHQGAISVGQTIAVMGTGVNHIYPLKHQRLSQDILNKGGALISELPRSMKAFPYHFPKRNRLVAGMSMGVLVVQAALKSGSLISARLALEAGREVFAIPGAISHPLSRGCHHLIRQGAKLVETPADILEELRAFQPIFTLGATCVTKPTELSELTPLAQTLLNHIHHAVTSFDAIILHSGLTAGEVSSMLLSLELDGYIESVAGGFKRILQHY